MSLTGVTRIRTFARLRGFVKEDDGSHAGEGGDGEGAMSFMTVGVGRDGLLDSDTDEVSCFESFDPATNSAVYRAAERPGTSSMPNARDPVPLRTSTHGGSSSAEGGKAFKFDGLFGPGATQSEVYDAAASNIVRGVLEGYNGAILAYGQTGSGKTHSMRGPSDDAACWPSSRTAARSSASYT